ncbi:MAG: heparinase II/III family protein [Armatimonadetes bacterium]|nr:heparinase II/III family protein [Armatimonadota bacterium]
MMFRTPLTVVPIGILSLSLAASLGSAPASAEPSTLYKPKDIQNARENIERYPWAQRIVGGWKHIVQFSMTRDREALRAFIPEFTPTTRYNQTCPACVGKQSRMGEGRFSWSSDAPDQLTCTQCNTIFPSEEYPETGRLELPHRGQTITYYQTPEERALPATATAEERGRHALRLNTAGPPMMTSFSGLIRRARASSAVAQVLPLAKLYTLTGEIAYAERALWIMERFVEVYPDYLWRSYRNYFADLPPAEVSANMGAHGGGGGRFPVGVIRHAYVADPVALDNGFFGAGRLQDHANDYGWLLDMTVAYDLIRDARYPDGRPLLDEEMKLRIVQEFLVPACEDWEHWRAVHNKGMGYFALSAAVGTLLEQPERVRHALNGFNRMLAERYHADGFYTDTPHYGLFNFSQLRPLPDILLGYSDPPDYQPQEGPRLENLDPYRMGRYQRVVEAPLRMLAPGNRLPVIADTAYDSPLRADYAELLAARFGGRYAALFEALRGARLSEAGTEYSLWYRDPDLQAPEGAAELPLRSEWFPGYHVGVLRAGRAEDTALYLTGHQFQWTIRTGHAHPDILALAYYAFGQELASDRGYFGGAMAPDRPLTGQYWTKSTASHNIVLVDDKCQPTEAPAGCHLELFGVAPVAEVLQGAGGADTRPTAAAFPVPRTVEVIQAAGFNAYPQCEEYRRTSSLIRAPDGQTYVVDFFRVKGGHPSLPHRGFRLRQHHSPA